MNGTIKQLLSDYFPEYNSYPVIVQSIDYAELVAEKFNQQIDSFEKWQLVLLTALFSLVASKFYYFYADLDCSLTKHLKKQFYGFLKKLPFINGKIMEELEKNKKGLEEDILKSNKGNLFIQSLPDTSLTQEQVLQNIEPYLKMNDLPWEDGAVSGCVYGADESLTKLTTKVYERFAWSNPMHADVFPNVRKMEAEVVRWTLNLFHGDEKACGTMTTGGTESIMLACKAYRDLAYEKGIKRPEMVIPITAHAAFDKAANFFRIKLHHVPVDPVTKKVNPKKLASYINSNTCMIVGSCPQFPHGAIDPIEELSKIALKNNVPLHVDACLGGYLVVFMQEAGYQMPLFDFRLKGVTSISCDTHKYAYTPKGSSVIMYRNTNYRKHQFFAAVEWPGGIYVSPTFAGSRAGSLIAMTWATLMYHGHKGYVDITRNVIETTIYITNEIRKIKGLKLMCEPDVSVVAFESSEFNILRLLDDMATKGWHLNALQNPSGIHIAVTKLHTKPGIAEKFIEDLKQCTKEIMSKDDRKLGKTAAIYCSTQGIPDKSLVADVTYLYLDACYNTKDSIPLKTAVNGHSNGHANGHTNKK